MDSEEIVKDSIVFEESIGEVAHDQGLDDNTPFWKNSTYETLVEDMIRILVPLWKGWKR